MDASAADDRTLVGRRASIVGIVCNVVLALAKGAVGIQAGSVSVIADAINNLMDTTSSVVTLIGFKLASKPADSNHPYGHGRYEYLAGLSVAVLVMVAGVELVQESFLRTLNPVQTTYSTPALVVLGASVVTKLWLMRYDRRIGARIGSQALLAAAEDSKNDAVATTAVLAGALLSRFAGISADGPLGMAVGVFVLRGGMQMVRETLNPLLGSKPDPEQVRRVYERILSYPGVLDAHDLMIHDYGPGHRFASAHVEMAAEEDPLVTHGIIDRIERDLRGEEGLATILHYDPVVTGDGSSEVADAQGRVLDAIRQVDARLTIHDLRVAREQDGVLLSFDCVLPEGAEAAGTDELAAAIEHEVRKAVPDARCAITFDTGFAPVTR